MRISLLQQFEQHKDETYRICFSPDGNTLWSSDGTAVYQWQRTTGDIWNYRECIPGSAHELQCTPDGKMIVFNDREETIHFCSFDGHELMTLSHPNHGMIYFTISPDQRWLVMDGRDGNILLWDMLKHQWSSIAVSEQEITGDRTAFYLRFAPNGRELVFSAGGNYEGNGHICQFDPVHEHYIIRRILPLKGINEMRISPNGKTLAIVSMGDVYVYDMEMLQLQNKFTAPFETYYDLLAFSPDSRFLLSSRSDGSIDIWSLATFECVTSFEAHPGPTDDMRHSSEPIGGLDWSTTGYIATGGTGILREDMLKEDLSLKIWKVEDEIA